MRPILPLLLAPFLLAGHPVSDLNKDGEISLGEFIARVDVIFAKADADFDGVLKQDEMMALYDLQMEADAKDRFRLADMDGDERLDEAEWLSTVVRLSDIRAMTGFDMSAVTDADGNIDQDGYTAMMDAETARMTRLQARAEALAGVPDTVPNPSSQAELGDHADAETDSGGNFILMAGSGEDFRMTPELYRSQQIFMFLLKDRDENDVLTLDEWGQVGLYGN